jgi:hypothetical protein
LIAAVLILLLAAGLFAVVTETDFIGSTVAGQGDCSYEPYTIDNRTFSTLSDAKTAYQNLGGQNWNTLKQNADLQVRDGVVKARVCGLG